MLNQKSGHILNLYKNKNKNKQTELLYKLDSKDLDNTGLKPTSMVVLDVLSRYCLVNTTTSCNTDKTFS